MPAHDAAAKIDLRPHAAGYPAVTWRAVLWHGVARIYGELEGRAQ